MLPERPPKTGEKTMTHQTEQQKQWARIVAKAWADDDYKARLIADPKAVLAAENVEFDHSMDFTVVEAAENQIVLVLPPKSSSHEPAQEGEERRSAWFFPK